MKPASDFEGVREFCKLFFTLGVSINGLLDSGGGVLVKGEFNSADSQTTFSLASQIQKEDSINNLFTVFFFFTKMLKPRIHKQQNKYLKQNPLAPTFMAYR